MTSSQLLLIAIAVGLALLVAFGVVVAATRRESGEEFGRDEAEREAALAAVPGGGAAVSRTARRAGTATIEMEKVLADRDPETEGMTRRQVLNRGLVLASIAGLTAFGGACLAFLWPKLAGGFGSVINAGNINEIKAQIESDKAPYYNPSGRFYLMTYETDLDDDQGDTLYPAIFPEFKSSGLIAIYQKCPHLGCRVPWCKTSQWFECPCHGSKYNSAGEWTGGPAPRGMWHFPLKLNGEQVSVNTGEQVEGPAKGTSTPVNAEAKGPHCVGI